MFMNDVIPYYAKDFREGCMRYASLFSIEMKLFAPVPILVLTYSLKFRKTALSLCLILVVAGQLIQSYVLRTEKINPSYFNMFDPQFLDVIIMKPWTHMDSYYMGVICAIIYREMNLRKLNIMINFAENRGKFDKLYLWLIQDGLGEGTN